MRRMFSQKIATFKNSWHWATEGQRDMMKLGLGLGLIILIGVGISVLGKPGWHRWQHDKALEQAHEFAEQHDYRSTLLALRRATEFAPDDITTWKEVARYLSDLGLPEAVVARQNVAALAPQDMGLRLAVVTEALRFGQTEAAQAVADGIDAASRQEVAFHRLAAALAVALGRSQELEEHLAAIVAARPGDDLARFNLAAVRLWSTDTSVAAQAQAELESLLAVPKTRIRAALELLKYAARTRDPGRVDRLVSLLLDRFGMPTAMLQVVAAGEPPGWYALLDALKTASTASGPADVARVARWLADIGQARETLLWIEGMPATIRDASDVASAAADLALSVDELRRLGSLLRAGAWGVWPDDAITLALATRVQQLRYNQTRAPQTWVDAVTACDDSLVGLRALTRMAASWRDPIGEALALETIVKRRPQALWACEALRLLYAQRGDLPKLWRLYDAWTQRVPGDLKVRAEWVRLGCILGSVRPEMVRQVQTWFENNPRNPVAALAWAEVLWQQNRSREALPLLALLPVEEREKSPVTFWLALVQADLGQIEAARASIAQAQRPGLGREEQELLRAALAKLEAPPETPP